MNESSWEQITKI